MDYRPIPGNIWILGVDRRRPPILKPGIALRDETGVFGRHAIPDAECPNFKWWSNPALHPLKFGFPYHPCSMEQIPSHRFHFPRLTPGPFLLSRSSVTTEDFPTEAGKTPSSMASKEAGELTLYLMDGHSQIFKAYHAIRELSGPGGIPTNAVFGFHQILTRLLRVHKPSHLAVVLDSEGPTFRHEMFDAYKANRAAPPEDLPGQIRLIIQMLEAMRIPTVAVPGYEADDLLAALTERAVAAGWNVVIVSADKDLMQLVRPSVTMLRLEADGEQMFDSAGVQAKMGVPPELVGDYLALVGDSSDNVPGVKGIGPKGAVTLLQQFGNLEAILTNTHQLKGRQKELLETGAESARLSRRLVALDAQAPVPENLDALVIQSPDKEALAALYRQVGFRRPLQELEQGATESPAPGRGWAGSRPSQRVPPRPAENAPPTTPARKATADGQADLFASEESSSEGASSSSFSGGIFSAVESSNTPGQSDVSAAYKTVLTADELHAVVDAIRAAGVLAIDTETDGTDPLRANLVGISVAWAPGEAAYVPLAHEDEWGTRRSPQLSREAVQNLLGPLLQDPAVRRLAHHAKYDWHILERHGFPVSDFAFDTMVASYVVLSDRRGHGLKDLAADLCALPMRPITDLIGSGRDQITFARVPLREATDYAARDADATLRVARELEHDLDAAGSEVRRIFEEFEMPLIAVLRDMEAEGLAIDPAVFQALEVDIDRELAELRRQIFAAAEMEFNLGSPKQLATVLFEKLGLKPLRKTKTGASTDAEVLEALADQHPVPRLMLEHRAFEKLKSTYVTVLPGLRHPETGRVHTTLHQHVAATGRLSSSDPNLQNIPVRTPWGRRIRAGFVPRDEHWRLVSADYSQVELRVLAHVSEDPALVRAYTQGLDVHRMTAASVFGVPESSVTSEQRDMAKTINFGIIYGMGANGLSQRLKIPQAEAKRFIEGYFSLYSGVKAWLDRTLSDARRQGYVETITGRRRVLPEINSSNFNQRGSAERMAVNAPIQGTAADMIKIAMIRLHQALKILSQEGRSPATRPDWLTDGPWWVGPALQARMVLQVHDELIFDAPEDELPRLLPLVRHLMEQALPLAVPVLVDIGDGANWAEC
jgi:DNA polymerase-1